MIESSYSEVFFLYLLFWMLLILWLWRREEARVRRNEWRIGLGRGKLFYCEECGKSFVNRDHAAGNICRCPTCNSVCFAVSFRVEWSEPSRKRQKRDS